MDNKTKNLLEAAKYVLDQTDNPSTGGRSIDIALDELRSVVNEIEKPKIEKHSYMVKDNGNKCPICNTELSGCHIGDYCPKDGCSYTDGWVWLTKEEAEQFKDKLLI